MTSLTPTDLIVTDEDERAWQLRENGIAPLNEELVKDWLMSSNGDSPFLIHGTGRAVVKGQPDRYLLLYSVFGVKQRAEINEALYDQINVIFGLVKNLDHISLGYG
jgi:hypothetical protein